MAINRDFVLNLAKILHSQAGYLETEKAPPEGGKTHGVRLNIPNRIETDTPANHSLGERIKAQDMQDRLVAFHRVIAEKAGIQMDYHSLNLTTNPHQYSYLVKAQLSEGADIESKFKKILAHIAALDPAKAADKKELDALAAKVDVVFNKLDQEHRKGFEQEINYRLKEESQPPRRRGSSYIA